MRKLMISLLLCIIILNFVSAEESGGTLIGKQNSCIQLPQQCASCSYVTLNSIQYPNMSRIILNAVMTKNESSFNYSFCDTKNLGNYVYCITGDVDGTDTVACKDFEITYYGEKLSGSQSYIYIIAISILVLLILGSYVLLNKLPSENSRGENGAIIQISQLKHLRKIMWGIIWGLSLAIVFIIANISYAYLQNQLLGSFFMAIYQIMLWTTIIMIPIMFIWLLYSMYKDAEFQKMINRGVDLGGDYI